MRLDSKSISSAELPDLSSGKVTRSIGARSKNSVSPALIDIARLAQRADTFRSLQRNTYKCILADPPWHFKARTALQTRNWTSARDAEKHYPVLGLDDIKALPVRFLAADDCHLFLWTTGPCLQMAFEVITAWGFRYSAIAFTWVKLRKRFNPDQLRFVPTADSDLHVGLGLTTRKNAEFCLLGRRGNARRNARDVREIILSPVREHSRKPEETYNRIERYCDGPYVELFARSQRWGWDSWGDEINKFEENGQCGAV